MGVPVSIRPDGDVRDELEAQARRNGVGLATPLREGATDAARDAPASARRASTWRLMSPAPRKAGPSTRIGARRGPMPADEPPAWFRAGSIVLADWRGDALPKQPNKRRPAVVVEDDGLFAPGCPNVILVPTTEDAARAIPDLAVPIAPTPENGCAKRCWAVSHLVATASKRGFGRRRPGSRPPSSWRSGGRSRLRSGWAERAEADGNRTHRPFLTGRWF